METAPLNIPAGYTTKFVIDAMREYLETALWSSVDDDGDPLDMSYLIDDFSADSVLQATQTVCEFLALTGRLAAGLTPETIGHNLWLNRNGHGCGFWDIGLGDRGDRLSDDAKSLGGSDAYVGDDGKIHLT